MISVRVSRPRETRNLTTPRGRKGGGRKGRIRAQRTFPAPFGRLGPSRNTSTPGSWQWTDPSSALVAASRSAGPISTATARMVPTAGSSIRPTHFSDSVTAHNRIRRAGLPERYRGPPQSVFCPSPAPAPSFPSRTVRLCLPHAPDLPYMLLETFKGCHAGPLTRSTAGQTASRRHGRQRGFTQGHGKLGIGPVTEPAVPLQQRGEGVFVLHVAKPCRSWASLGPCVRCTPASLCNWRSAAPRSTVAMKFPPGEDDT
jgi:hypothetical protein